LPVFIFGWSHYLLDQAVAPRFVVGVDGAQHTLDGLFVAEGVVPAGADLVEGLGGGEDAVVGDDGLGEGSEGGREGGKDRGREGEGGGECAYPREGGVVSVHVRLSCCL